MKSDDLSQSNLERNDISNMSSPVTEQSSLIDPEARTEAYQKWQRMRARLGITQNRGPPGIRIKNRFQRPGSKILEGSGSGSLNKARTKILDELDVSENCLD